MNIKKELYNQCEKFVNNRLQTIQDIISSNQKALQSETKSSAGDKHETGRAMLQLEMEKAGQQLQGVLQMKETLAKMDVAKNSTISHLGSLVKTNEATYFLSISAGKLIVENENYFAVSVSSPIGNLLLGKQENEIVIFNGKTSLIKKIL
ncbi:3-oxoacyl-ACP synthase [Polaribacter huanghezhanensis]|uniref:3-oxoacyl-ACP synthase n=1 Tax=Polaribacter huanghezhanensis TaxID=1354726 RepID=UPI0026496797|nr:3-oxoacyl-ACP synthase [Polaribacter huanghezhanensis]